MYTMLWKGTESSHSIDTKSLNVANIVLKTCFVTTQIMARRYDYGMLFSF